MNSPSPNPGLAPTLVSLFENMVAKRGDAPAIIWEDGKLSFQELETRSRGLAQNLIEKFQVCRGEPVGILLQNCPEFIVALYAIYRCGGVVVPINSFLKAAEIQHILKDANIRVLVSSNNFSEVLSAQIHLGLTPLRQVVRIEDPTWENMLKPQPGLTLPNPGEEDMAMFVYTSGTTGKSKGVMLSHGNLQCNVVSCWRSLKAVAGDRLLLALPMFHSFMLTVGIAVPISAGSQIVLLKSLDKFHTLLEELVEKEVTILIGVPPMYRALSAAKVALTWHWKCKVRLAISGSAPLPVETLTAFTKKFKFPLIEGYGLSEASPVVSLNPIEGEQKPGSVGLPIKGVAVTILNDLDEELPMGEVGEICVAGLNVMKGYHNQPDETAAVLRNGWLHTGDLGKKDKEGYIYIVDRKKDMLLVNGQNVYPREIEEVLYKFPGVKEAAVIGKEDRKGEVPVAFVVANDGEKVDEKAMLAFCKDKLADYKLPRRFQILVKLPRNATNKVDKNELARFLERMDV